METIHCDLTVVGGGIAGMCAALAAARHGLHVALVNDRPVLGGNASSEVAVSISGAASGGNSYSVYAREGGIVEEIKLTRLRYNQTAQNSHSYQDWPMEDAAYFDLIYQEKNIDLFLNTSVRSVETQDGRIQATVAVQLGSERDYRFESPLFVDATGDGTVGHGAGASYMWGEEASDEFEESLAPPKATQYVMGSTILLFSRDAGKRVVYKRPDFAYDITKLDYFQNIGNDALERGIHREGDAYCGFWWIEIGGLLDTIKDNESITFELRRLTYGVWDYIKNSGKFENTDNLLLDKVTHVAGKRESRRFIGDYVFTQKDIENKPGFADAAAIGGWSMDVHAPEGIYDNGPATHWYPNNGIYNIPLRALYSKNVPNLLLAGRDISCTHIALGSTRVMATCGCEGQAVGTAAWLCRKYKTAPSQVAADHVRELQEALQRDDQTIVGMAEKNNEELIRDLKITASSVKEYENTDPIGSLSPEKSYCLALPAQERIDSVEVWANNDSDRAVTLNVSIYSGSRPENYVPETYLKDIAVSVPAKFRGWLCLKTETEVGRDKKLYLLLRQSGLSFGYNRKKPVGAVTFCRQPNTDRQTLKEAELKLSRMEENICFRRITPLQRIYAAENLMNGFSRPYGMPNLWVSADGGEQTITLEYEKPKNVEEVQLIFDTELEYDNFDEIMPSLIKDYTIEFIAGNGNIDRVEVTDNYLRMRRHTPAAADVKKISLTLHSTYGSPYKQMYAIRLY